MIKPLRAISGGTLVANPRRKRRKAKAGRKHGFASLSRNPSPRRSKKAKRNPSAFGRMKSRRNPAMDIGGVDIMSLAGGSLITILGGNIAQGIVKKYATASITSMPGANALPVALVGLGAYFGAKKAKGQLKSALKITVITSAFECLNQLAGPKLQELTASFLPSTSGYYNQAGQRVNGMAGTYLPSPNRQGTNGAWLQASAPSTAGAFAQARPMFGVV